jgi:hypothetical protein
MSNKLVLAMPWQCMFALYVYNIISLTAKAARAKSLPREILKFLFCLGEIFKTKMAI